MTRRAFITGVSGLTLTPAEIDFIAETRPFGLILFARNVAEPAQVAALCATFRYVLGDPGAPVLVDQEGGRVQRLRQPHWATYPPASTIGRLAAAEPEAGRRAAYLKARLIGDDLAAVGITVNCAPTLDLAVEGAHPVIGERALSADPLVIARLGRAAIEGFMDSGVLPVIKHMPGHGRGLVDSHHELPSVATPRAELEETDFAPFRLLADAPFGMTAHVVYAAIDGRHPGTQSPVILTDIVRRAIGFSGALMTDDLGMRALAGSFRERTEASHAAGVDLALHCSGEMAEMVEVAAGSPILTGPALARCEAALARRKPTEEALDRRAAEAGLAALLGTIGAGDSFRSAELPAWGVGPAR